MATPGSSDESSRAELASLRAEVESLRADVGRREEAERTLAECEERHRTFIAASSEAIWRIELEQPLALSIAESDAVSHAFQHGYVAECNDAMARMYGFSTAEDFVGTRLGSMLPRDDPKNIEMLRMFLRGGCRLEDAETHELDREGRARVFLNNLVGIIEDGKLLRVWGTQRDITDRRRLEEELRQAAKMEAVGRLAAGLAHDFNNLLTAIVGHSEMAEERIKETATMVKAALATTSVGTGGGMTELNVDEACAEVQSDIEEIRLAALRASSLTRQLLSFTRKQVVQPVILDLNALLLRTEKLLRRLLPGDVEIMLELEPEIWPVLADPGQMEQVILNLAVNARDAMPGGGRLVVRTANITFSGDDTLGFIGEHVLMAVMDTGSGLDDEVKHHLFEPYYTTKDVGQGTGLGLATCHSIVTQSGGRIEVSSMLRSGTTFRIYLPRCEGHAVAPEGSDGDGQEYRGSETILLVEDESAVRSLALRVLRSRGYEVLEAANGHEAMALAAEHHGPIQLLLTDMVMPRMGGLALGEALHRERPELKVLYTSGFPERGVVGASDGVKHFLPKPFTLVDLVRRVRLVLDAPR